MHEVCTFSQATPAFLSVDRLICLVPRRLSYHQRIVDIVPPTFSVLIPAEPISIYKYGDESCKCFHPSSLFIHFMKREAESCCWRTRRTGSGSSEEHRSEPSEQS